MKRYFNVSVGSSFSGVEKQQQHPFHIVSPSYTPPITALAGFLLTLTIVSVFHSYFHIKTVYPFVLGLAFMIHYWGTTVSYEGSEGWHTKAVLNGLKIGFLLFIVSEIMFFFSFFWAFFHFALAPSIWIGCVWPPVFMPYVDPLSIPLLNTILLLSSGVTITYVHRSAKLGSNSNIVKGLFWTILYGVIFMGCQYYEYTHLAFNISDSVYGSIFYLLTGFHGFHVTIGLIMLTSCFLRVYDKVFRADNHLGLEAAIYYWHFVDVVWVFLYLSVYIWGSR